MELNFKGTFVKKLPDKFKYAGTLNLDESDIEVLPEGLTVGGDLILTNSKIQVVENAIITGNLYVNNKIQVADNNIIGGKIIFDNDKVLEPLNTGHTIETSEGEIVTYLKIMVAASEDMLDQDPDYYRPEILFYKGINNKRNAVSYKEDDKEFVFFCTGVKDGCLKVYWNRAKEAGIDQYKDLDIDTPMSVDKIKYIFKLCSGSCDSGCERFISDCGYIRGNNYTIREVREKIINYPTQFSAKQVFIDFFDK